MNNPQHPATNTADQTIAEPVDALARAVHWSLLTGMVLSSLLMCAGLVLALAHHEIADQLAPPALPDLLHLAATGSGVALLEVGILLLLFTPVVRVIVLAIGWTLRRETRMAPVALVVLALLALSLVLGFG
jgi:hypothetical protein